MLAERARRVAERLRDSGDTEAAALIEELYETYEGTRRRLVRLGYDLHDGPLQAIAAGAADLRHFQAQLGSFVAGEPHGPKLVDRVDDLVARALTLGEDVRELILGGDNDQATKIRFSSAFEALADAYAEFELQLAVDPAIDDLGLTDSQRIAIVRIVRSALDNVAQHSGAKHATVTLGPAAGGVVAEVTDDGCGFDVELASRSERSIGLAAMHERARLLDGELSIESRVGGPTTVRVSLPAWRGTSAIPS
jgi:signal transduction histidine kinase